MTKPGDDGSGSREVAPRQVGRDEEFSFAGLERHEKESERAQARPITNDLSWSKSRASTLSACERRYFLHYYGYWGGWDETADDRKRRLWVLRQLATREQWAGTSVHDAIALFLSRLRAGRPIEIEALIDMTRSRMRREFVHSRRRRYWNVRKSFGLVEHEYEDPVSNESWRANWGIVERCLLHFGTSDVLREVRGSDPSRWRPIDKLDTFEIDGVKIWVAPDFAYEKEDGTLEIIDWKTGAPRESDRQQVFGYAMFAESKWKVPRPKIRGALAYLSSGDLDRFAIDDVSIEAFLREARESIGRMRSFLQPDDPTTAREENFRRTDDIGECHRCPFRAECWTGGKVPS